MDGNQEFPIPFKRFAATLKGTRNEIWTRLLKINHGRENHTRGEWMTLIDQYRTRLAHPKR